MTLIYTYGLMVALIVIIMFLRPTYLITITVNTHHRARVTRCMTVLGVLDLSRNMFVCFCYFHAMRSRGK